MYYIPDRIVYIQICIEIRFNWLIYRVPTDVSKRTKWIQSIENHQPFDQSIITQFRVCSLHFNRDDLITTNSRKIVKTGKWPSIFPNRVEQHDQIFCVENVNAGNAEVHEDIEYVDENDLNIRFLGDGYAGDTDNIDQTTYIDPSALQPFGTE